MGDNTFSKNTDEAEVDKILTLVNTPRMLWVHRPVYVHEKAPDGNTEACPCCGSKRSRIVEKKEHLDVLIDRFSGKRKPLHKQKDKKRWWDFAAKAKRIDMPIRCYRKQRNVILDKTHKIICVFGGNRSGKTQAAAEWLVDQWLERGGKGAKFWWVAPSRAQTQIGVNKLVRGEITDRAIKPLIHPLLVVSYPDKETSTDQAIRLIDGSIIGLRYAGRSGDHLKGENIIAAVLDEGTAVKHEINWTILIARTMDSGGQVLTATTPVAGHWLKTYSDTAEDLERAANDADYDGAVVTNLSCYDNPWISPKEIDRMIAALGGKEDSRVKREVFGLWVAEGLPLWRHFKHTRHVVEWPGRDVNRHGYIDITDKVAQEAFYGYTESPHIPFFLGVDFNYRPFSVAVCKVLVARGESEVNPDNWILYIEDEIIRPAKSSDDFSEWLAKKAGSMHGRGLTNKYFAGSHAIPDGTGFHHSRSHSNDRQTADANVMEWAGFVVRPPETDKNGKPKNPGRLIRHGFMNHLMHTNRFIVNGTRCAQLINSLENEVADERGDTLKRSATKADRMSGITDAVGYAAYGAMYEHCRPDRDRDAA